MLRYHGNFQDVDWNDLLTSLKSQSPAYVGPRHRAGDIKAPGIDAVAGLWEKAGYKTIDQGGNATWDMFLPGVNFDPAIVKKFAKFINSPGCTNAWIARVNPGRVAPWHWDVTDNEATISQTNCIRYHCHIQALDETLGHTLAVEDECLYHQRPGEVYQWPDRKAWHGAANFGFEPFYSFHFWYSW